MGEETGRRLSHTTTRPAAGLYVSHWQKDGTQRLHAEQKLVQYDA